MDRILAKLERRLGRFAIPNVTAIIVAGMAVMFCFLYVRPELRETLVLDTDRVRAGEVWRLVTYLFIPRATSLFWIFFSLSFTWMVGSTLENEWGEFKFNVFYLIGMLGTTVAAVITGAGVGNYYLNMSLLFAFATLWPDYEISMFVVSVPVKWLALFFAANMGYDAVTSDWATRAAVLASLANYFLFFGAQIVAQFRSRNLAVRQAARRGSHSAEEKKATAGRQCAICGKREDDGADIRVCTCEKCQPARTLCLEHARNH